MSKPVAIVTGAASGMGLAATKHLLQKGYRVAMADVNEAAGEALRTELGEHVMFRKTDITKYEELATLFLEAFKWGGDRLDVLAANAGIDDRQSIYVDNSSMPLDSSGIPLPMNLKALDVCLTSVFQAVWLFKFYVRQNKTSRGGKVIIISSNAAFYGFDKNPQYCAAKHGLVGLTRSVGLPLHQHDNITVNCICPSFVLTGLCPPHVRDKFPKEHITPMSTILDAYDRFLDNDAITGQVIDANLDKLYLRDPPPFVSDSQRWLVMECADFWEEAYKSVPDRR